MPMATYGTQSELLRLLIARNLKCLGWVYPIVCHYLFNSDIVVGAENLKFFLGIDHFCHILCLMHCDIDELAVVVNPEVAILIAGCGRRSFVCGNDSRASCLQLIWRDTIARVVMAMVSFTNVWVVGVPVGLPYWQAVQIGLSAVTTAGVTMTRMRCRATATSLSSGKHVSVGEKSILGLRFSF